MKRKRLFGFVLLLFAGMIYLVLQNTWIDVENIDLKWGGGKEKKEIKIVQVSDIHLKSGGKIIEGVIEKVKKQEPDIILMTGDIIDSSDSLIDSRLDVLSKGLAQITRVYSVSGNHEVWSGEIDLWEKILEDNGVKVIDNENEYIEIKGEKINIIGISDQSSDLRGIDFEDNNIILCHRPERVGWILSSGKLNGKNNIMFSGHAHGGQFRIPFIKKGIIAPGQGAFPKYTSGVYEFSDLTMIVSRGIGNSIIPIRINNRPHIPVINLGF